MYALILDALISTDRGGNGAAPKGATTTYCRANLTALIFGAARAGGYTQCAGHRWFQELAAAPSCERGLGTINSAATNHTTRPTTPTHSTTRRFAGIVFQAGV